MKLEYLDNIVFKIGKNSQENWDLLNNNENFYWFHLNSFPSCHVIIENENPSEEEIIFASNLCKNNTKYKNLSNLKICYTQLKNLKKGTDIGSVIFKSRRKVKTISI